MKILPVLMIKNEEIWIRRVVEPLCKVYEKVIIGDTGSTDSTVESLGGLDNIHFEQYGDCDQAKLGKLRDNLLDIAKDYGATHAHIVDGDHLYTTRYLRWLLANPMPETAKCGFHFGRDLAELDNGEILIYPTDFNSAAIIPVETRYINAYPYESNTAYHPEIPGWSYYWNTPDSSYCFYHLHHLTRSRLDKDVLYRLKKKNQFSMIDRKVEPVEFFLKSQADYKDIE